MKTYTCLHCGEEFEHKTNAPVKYPYCFKPECRRAKHRHELRRQNPVKVVKTHCLHCGKPMTLKGKSTSTKYPFCEEKECQEAKIEHRRKLNAQYFREFKERQEDDFNYIYEPTGNTCEACGKPIMRKIEIDNGIRIVLKENRQLCDQCEYKIYEQDYSFHGIQKANGMIDQTPITFNDFQYLEGILDI